jgi:hypothetical protein
MLRAQFKARCLLRKVNAQLSFLNYIFRILFRKDKCGILPGKLLPAVVNFVVVDSVTLFEVCATAVNAWMSI